MLIDQHGDDASIRATQRVDELADEGDMDGAVAWRRILAGTGRMAANHLQ